VKDKKRDGEIFATLRFPKPEDIKSLRVGEIPAAEFVRRADLVPPDAEEYYIATLQVFTYIVEDENRVALLGVNGNPGHYWEPVVQRRPRRGGGDGRFINLHIFSSEDHPEEPNQKSDLEQLVALLGADVRLEDTFTYQPGGIGPYNPEDPTERPPDGVDPKRRRI